MKGYVALLEKVYEDNTKPKENLERIKKFLRTVKNEDLSIATQKLDCIGLIVFSKWCQVTFDDLSEDLIFDYVDYLERYKFERKGKIKSYSASSIYTYKSVLRKFLKTIGRGDLANCIKNRNPSTKKLPEDLLNRNEVEAMINAATSVRDKAMIATFYESGARRGELSATLLKHVQFDDNGAVLTLPSGKTGARRIRLVFAASYLRQWLECHPTKEVRESPLFVSFRKPYPRLSDIGLYKQLQRVADRAKVKKKVNPHSWRHARATHLAEHLTEQQLKKYLGWTDGSSMAATYVHLSGKDIDNAILKMHGITIEDTHTDGLKVGRCPRCKELNPEKSLYCGKCGLPLKEETKNKIEKDMQEIDMEFMKAVAVNPKLLEALAEELNKIQQNKTQ